MSEGEQAPKTICYKRNTDLDPQLVSRHGRAGRRRPDGRRRADLHPRGDPAGDDHLRPHTPILTGSPNPAPRGCEPPSNGASSRASAAPLASAAAGERTIEEVLQLTWHYIGAAIIALRFEAPAGAFHKHRLVAGPAYTGAAVSPLGWCGLTRGTVARGSERGSSGNLNCSPISAALARG